MPRRARRPSPVTRVYRYNRGMSWTVIASGVAIVLAVMLVAAGKRKAPRARAAWGEWPGEARDIETIARYAEARQASSPRMDRRTWEDLNMDDVFRVLDRAESLVGQQALYARLGSAPAGEHMEAFEALVTRFSQDLEARTTARRALGRLRKIDGHDLLWLTEPNVLVAAPWHVVFPIIGATMIASIVLIPFNPVAIFALAAGMLVNLILRSRAAPDLFVVAGAFRQVGPVLAAAGALKPLVTTDVAAIAEPLERDLPKLSTLRRVASWAGRDTSGSASGDISALGLEFLNLLLSLDGNALFFGARELHAHTADLRRVLHAVGEIDAAQSIASYRAATNGWTRPSRRPAGSRTVLAGVRHPLLPDAVPNSLSLSPPNGVVITGSNMSGKTTFLRTLGVTAVLAQTINTCVCDAYEAPVFVVRSCIGRADDPSSGKSYYLVEVESVLDLLRAAESAEPHLILFDELFRGTNTVERIAAGEAVLVSLIESHTAADRASPHIIVVATHDLELVDLLAGRYAPYHFTDIVDDEGLAFDYQLREGPALGRNAIALLKQRGAPASLVARATARANALDEARSVVGRR